MTTSRHDGRRASSFPLAAGVGMGLVWRGERCARADTPLRRHCRSSPAFQRINGSTRSFAPMVYVTLADHRARRTARLSSNVFRTKSRFDGSKPPAPSTPRSLLIAHCAISARSAALWHDSAFAERLGPRRSDGDPHVWIDRWSPAASGQPPTRKDRRGRLFQPTYSPRDTSRSLTATPCRRKGPSADAASYYYSLPTCVRRAPSRVRAARPRTGEAWLDHEWSSEYLTARAVGWDWIGLI